MYSHSFTRSTGKERHLGVFTEKASSAEGTGSGPLCPHIQAEMGSNGALIHSSVNGPVDLFSLFRPLICP